MELDAKSRVIKPEPRGRILQNKVSAIIMVRLVIYYLLCLYNMVISFARCVKHTGHCTPDESPCLKYTEDRFGDGEDDIDQESNSTV